MKIYDTKSREVRLVGSKNGVMNMYCCGPTVYRDAHVGNLRTFLLSDLIARIAMLEGMKVHAVQNITDVGHLVNDADSGEDKIAKKARLEQLEPMEIAQFYTDSYHQMLHSMHVLPASIEPRASGHIIEQIEMIEEIIKNGLSSLSHRGPDQKGYWISPDGKVGIGQTRLSINDLSDIKLPLSNTDGSIQVITNAEIYNFAELKKDLELKGYQFKTTCDVEVIPHLYEEYGINFINRFDILVILY